MPRVSAKVVGAERVVAGLKALAPAVQDDLKPVTKRVATAVKQTAKSSAPRSSATKGAGRRHLADTGSVKVSKDGLEGKVTFGGKGARHGHLVEGGTQGHKIGVREQPKRGAPRRVMSDGTRVFGRVVNHPGAKAQPFLAPALQAHAEEFVSGVDAVLRRHTDG
jgi:HK97 gp10 family phage protein